METLEIVYRVPPGTYARAFRGHLWRKVGGFAMGAGLALVLAAAVASGEPWLSGFLAGLAVAYLLNLARLYRRAVTEVRAREGSEVHLRISDSGIEFDSDRGRSACPWSRLKAVRPRGEVVELDLGPNEAPVWLLAAALAGAPLAALEQGIEASRRSAPAAPAKAPAGAAGT